MRHGPFQLKSFIDRCAYEGLDFGLAKSGESTTAKSADKAFRSGETHSVTFVGASIQNLDSFRGHHAYEFCFAATLVIMIAQNGNDRNSQANQGIQQRFHLIRLPVVGEIAGQYQQVGLVAHAVQLVAQGSVALGGEMKVGGSSDSHLPYLLTQLWFRGRP